MFLRGMVIMSLNFKNSKGEIKIRPNSFEMGKWKHSKILENDFSLLIKKLSVRETIL